MLDRLISAVQAGESRALVVRGEPGMGKTALLDYVAGRASGCRVARAVGVQSEMELAFAAVHQLCAPVLDLLEQLPAPQRDALRTAFGLSAGPAPDRFLVALAVLSLLSEVAGQQPLMCLVDDEQWLDRASAQTLAFVARRLGAESVGMVFATRVPGAEVAGLPELAVAGLADDDARSLLDSALAGPLDVRVRDQLVAETRGNPLALLELPRGMTPAQLAGGFGLLVAGRLSGRIEESFRRQLDALGEGPRRLLLVAAADSSGDPLLVWRAAERLGVGPEAASAAGTGLVEFGAQVRFRHPLVRSATYRSASEKDRQEVHGALAEVTDPRTDPDRRAWHQAQATSGTDEDVAAELDRSAGRAQARGGLAAAAAFGERAALLTPEPGRRAQRLLAAAWAKREAGAPDAALGLLVAVEAGPPDVLRDAGVQRLRGQIAFDQRRGGDAPRLLLGAALSLEPFDAGLAREAHLESLVAAMWADDLDHPGGVPAAARAARAAPPGPDPPRAVDVVLDAAALRLTDGYAAGAPALARARDTLMTLNNGSDHTRDWLWLAGSRASGIIALELWDFEAWHALAVGQVRFARDTGALVHLQSALTYLGWTYVVAGELATAAPLVEEGRLIAEATGNSPIEYTAMMLAAWRGQEPAAAELIEATAEEATARGLGRLVSFAALASSVRYNGLGQHDAARDAAWWAMERDPVGHGPLVVPELAEAAARTGDLALVRTALDWLSVRTQVTPTEWALGIQARVRALLAKGAVAESGYQESIERLGRTRVRAELARSHLLYGEWLRRERRRADARDQLRTACEMLDAMGIAGFAERARRELQATGETARKRTVQATVELTAQEAQVARLAREGLSNPQIGARLFISTRTVQYHLGKVFTKLGITSRAQLDQVMPAGPGLAG
jgi:DNA-binding CsgD family transcriptional regulator